MRQLLEPLTAEALFDCLPDVVYFVKNSRCEYVVVNRTLVERCGYQSKDELLGRTADQLFPAPFGRSYRAQDEEVLRTGFAIRDKLELHFYPTARFGWCLTNKLPLRGHDGGIAGLYGLSRDLQSANERSEDFSHVASAVERIRAEYHRPLQVTELAASAGLSVYQFEHRIRRIFHLTAGQLIQKVRMDAAVDRLLESNDSVAKIAAQCGYTDQSAFTRKFREMVGLAPSDYRRDFRHFAPTAMTLAVGGHDANQSAAAAASPLRTADSSVAGKRAYT
ncbi:MAG TPA: AraC family transcriptional regulator [Casimicrobiaceae bacterium]|jgi:AraC-like DNA-binding protein